MRKRAAVSVVLVLGLLLGTSACRKTIVYPIYRRPDISSVVAFPTILGPGDSSMITITASDPDGDPLFYDWEAYNGLTIKGGHDDGPYNALHGGQHPSIIVYAPTTWSYDTAFVWCRASDRKGGSDSRQVRFVFRN